MYGSNEVSAAPTFSSDDWDSIFGRDDEEGDIVREANKNNSERIVCPSLNPIVYINNSEITSLKRKQDDIHSIEKSRDTISSMVVMDLYMKRGRILRLKGNIVEANALNTAGFAILNLLSKVVDLLQLNGCIHVGSLMLEAVKTSINKDSNEWESLILCTESIHALIDELRMKSAKLVDMEQLEIENKPEKKLDKEELLAKLTNERKKQKLVAILEQKHKEANEKRKRRCAIQQTESHLVFLPTTTDPAENHVETSSNNKDAILKMAANKYKIRTEQRRKQIRKTSQISEQRKCLSQSSVSSVSNTSFPVAPTLPNDNSFNGPINAEDLMENCEESDISNSIILPSFPMQKADNHYGSQQQSHSFVSSSGEPRNCHASNHIRNDFPAVKGTKCMRLVNNIPDHASAPSHLSTASKILNFNRSQLDINSATRRNPIRSKFLSQLSQKCDNDSIVKIRKKKISRKPNQSVNGEVQLEKKNILFADENKYSTIEMSSNPTSTTDAIDVIAFRGYRKKYPQGLAVMPGVLCNVGIYEQDPWDVKMDNLTLLLSQPKTVFQIDEKRREIKKIPPRKYDFFLRSTIPRPIGSVNARSFCESCEFTRADIRNWLIVGSRFDYLDEDVFDVKRNGCPKTHISRANYPPVHFRILSDALIRISTNVGGLKIFLAVGEDWIVKKSMLPDEFMSFIKNFAHVLHELYVKQYTFEQTREMEFTDNLEKLKSHYAYVEMPSIILFTIPRRNDPETEIKCNFYNSAIRELIRNWDATSESPYYHNATKQCIELRLIDWRQICINENADSNSSMITILMKHLMEEWDICMAPKDRS